VTRRVVEIGNFITPNDLGTKPDLYRLRWEPEGGLAVMREWRPRDGDASPNLASPFTTGRVRVWVTGVNYSTTSQPEPGSTYYLDGQYTEQPVVSDWTQLGPAPPPPASTVTIPRLDLAADVAELEASLAYRLGWGRVTRPTKRLRSRLG